MVLVKKHKLKFLDNFISQLSMGIPFVDWAEKITQELVDNAITKKYVIDIDQLLKYKNITLRFANKQNESIYKAHLIKNNNCFELILNTDRVTNNNEIRFIIAHEIAHTLFYQKTKDGIEKNSNLSYGSQEVENICDYLALCLLLPKNYVEEEIGVFKKDNINLKNKNENFLKFIFHLAAKYQIDWHYIAYRLIYIYNFLPNSLCIEFSKKLIWQIKWVSQTQELSDKKLFIPIRQKAESKFPSAKRAFEIILNEALAKGISYGYVIVSKQHFTSNYQGNIKQFIKIYFTNEYDKLKIYFRINRSDNIILLFPFNGLLK
jgi:Zn-dependent peptidase ImmA (M78 family)